ncbi:MAG: hypothetical protein QY303_10395 [Vicingaceae bacterium]|nr:MAG: hypothetical protein QY303_10395 [Vicingaceae bacterium]
MDKEARRQNSTCPQAGGSCFVGQESTKFEVLCFVGSSALKIPAYGQLQTFGSNQS